MKNGKEGTVKEIMMGSPMTLSPEDTLDLVNDVISLGRIRHILVQEDGRLVGLISERDLIGGAVPAIFALKQKEQVGFTQDLPDNDFMRKRVVTVSPDTNIKEAARLMAEKKIGCVSVVSAGALIRLVTAANVLRYVERLL